MYAKKEQLQIRNKVLIVQCELLFNDKMFKENQIEKYSSDSELESVT